MLRLALALLALVFLPGGALRAALLPVAIDSSVQARVDGGGGSWSNTGSGQADVSHAWGSGSSASSSILCSPGAVSAFISTTFHHDQVAPDLISESATATGTLAIGPAFGLPVGFPATLTGTAIKGPFGADRGYVSIGGLVDYGFGFSLDAHIGDVVPFSFFGGYDQPGTTGPVVIEQLYRFQAAAVPEPAAVRLLLLVPLRCLHRSRRR